MAAATAAAVVMVMEPQAHTGNAPPSPHLLEVHLEVAKALR